MNRQTDLFLSERFNFFTKFEHQRRAEMLNRQQLKEYRQLRGLSTRDVASYCKISQPLIVQIENGDREITEYNHKEITNGIIAAYTAKKIGKFIKPPRVNQPKRKKKGEANTK